MENSELKKELDANIKQLKLLSSDARFADRLIDKILSIKGQLMVEPTEVMIKTSDIKFQHKYGGFEVKKTKDDEYIFHIMGYSIIVSPWSTRGNSSLYEMLQVLCVLQEKKDTDVLTADEIEILDNIIYSINTICTIPLTAFVNDDITKILCDAQISILSTLSKGLKHKLMPEDKKKDLEFVQRHKAMEDIKDELDKSKK